MVVMSYYCLFWKVFYVVFCHLKLPWSGKLFKPSQNIVSFCGSPTRKFKNFKQLKRVIFRGCIRKVLESSYALYATTRASSKNNI